MESVEELCDHIALINEAEKILDGSKQAIKNAYRSNSYRVRHKSELNDLAPGYKLINSSALEEGGFESTVQLVNGDSPNQLISSLMTGTEIYAFEELIPSVNDIFIQKVKEVNNG